MTEISAGWQRSQEVQCAHNISSAPRHHVPACTARVDQPRLWFIPTGLTMITPSFECVRERGICMYPTYCAGWGKCTYDIYMIEVCECGYLYVVYVCCLSLLIYMCVWVFLCVHSFIVD